MVMADPQVLHRGMVVEAAEEHPLAGPHRLVGNPVKTGSADVFRPAPTLGQHNEEILNTLHPHERGEGREGGRWKGREGGR
jgi:crotonobetainyl-CoA:carnitine CoA-transferase CaiB-like acyl-CoA transferase